MRIEEDEAAAGALAVMCSCVCVRCGDASLHAAVNVLPAARPAPSLTAPCLASSLAPLPASPPALPALTRPGPAAGCPAGKKRSREDSYLQDDLDSWESFVGTGKGAARLCRCEQPPPAAAHGPLPLLLLTPPLAWARLSACRRCRKCSRLCVEPEPEPDPTCPATRRRCCAQGAAGAGVGTGAPHLPGYRPQLCGCPGPLAPPALQGACRGGQQVWPPVQLGRRPLRRPLRSGRVGTARCGAAACTRSGNTRPSRLHFQFSV